MATVPKIKIVDNIALRIQLDIIYETATQQQIAKWALDLAEHVLRQFAPQFLENEIVSEAFFINKSWQEGLSRVHELRQAGFRVHSLARAQNEDIAKAALRVAGQAVASGHKKEHGMIASDYTIKCFNLMFPDNIIAVSDERSRQIDKLKTICIL